MNDVRVRFGVRAPWPFPNALTFVRRMTEGDLMQGTKLFDDLRAWLRKRGCQAFADRLFIELS